MDILPTNKIVPYGANNRTHPEEQIERIARSIREFGFNQPIVVDEKNVVLVGHGRLLAAQSLGLKECPVLQKKGLTETQKRAYRILDNKLQNDSSWEFKNLELELSALEQDGFGLEEWGLDSLKDLFPVEEPEVSEDDFLPPDEVETVIKRGDLIELGKHRVLCGDSTCSKSWMPVNVVFTSPPYNRGKSVKLANKSVGDSSYLSTDDDLGDQEYQEFLQNILTLALDHAECVAINLQLLAGNKRAVIRWLADNVQNFADHLVWAKQQAAPAAAKNVVNTAHELIFLFAHGDANRSIPTADFHGTRSSLINVPPQHSNESSDIHAATFPVAFAAECLKSLSKQGSTICDPFIGSGTTLIACEQLNRTCYGMEIEPKYCEVIIQRYKAYCEKNSKPFICKVNGSPYQPSTL